MFAIDTCFHTQRHMKGPNLGLLVYKPAKRRITKLLVCVVAYSADDDDDNVGRGRFTEQLKKKKRRALKAAPVVLCLYSTAAFSFGLL